MGNVSQMHRNQCECNRVCPPAAQHGLASGPLAEKWGPGNSRPHWSQVFLDRQDRTEWAGQALLPAWALFIFISALAEVSPVASLSGMGRVQDTQSSGLVYLFFLLGEKDGF